MLHLFFLSPQSNPSACSIKTEPEELLYAHWDTLVAMETDNWATLEQSSIKTRHIATKNAKTEDILI